MKSKQSSRAAGLAAAPPLKYVDALLGPLQTALELSTTRETCGAQISATECGTD